MMTALLIVAGMAFVFFLLVRSFFSYEAREGVFVFLLIVMGALSWAAYLNFDDIVALWVAIKNLPNTVTTFLTNTRDAIRAAMTGWALVACGLFLGSGIAIGTAATWASGKVLRAVQVGQLKRELEQAREETKREQENARQVEETRERDRAIIANVKEGDMRMSRQAGKDRGRRISAVGELKRRREREGKLREQLAEAHREIERLKRALPPASEAQ